MKVASSTFGSSPSPQSNQLKIDEKSTPTSPRILFDCMGDGDVSDGAQVLFLKENAQIYLLPKEAQPLAKKNLAGK